MAKPPKPRFRDRPTNVASKIIELVNRKKIIRISQAIEVTGLPPQECLVALNVLAREGYIIACGDLTFREVTMGDL